MSKNEESAPEHHKQQSLCTNRAPYRQGRRLTAVKVYTINDESVHLLIYGVPKINLRTELKALCQKHGKLKDILLHPSNTQTEIFTECYQVTYEKIQAARHAKRQLDVANFYGGSLHVCYAPEKETIQETRDKLKQRRIDVARRLVQQSLNNELDKSKEEVTQNIEENDEKEELKGRMVTVRKNGYLDERGAIFGELYNAKQGFVKLKYVDDSSSKINEGNISSSTRELLMNKNVPLNGSESNKILARKRKRNEDMEDKVKAMNRVKESLEKMKQSYFKGEDNVGKMVACEEVNKPRVYHVPQKSVNKIHFNIKNTKL